MIRAGIVLLIAILACATAMAQEGNPYNGNWAATWIGAKAMRKNVANVVIHDSGGTFQNQHASRNNPCVGIKAPIAVTTATADELVFVIKFSTALGGCKDAEVTLKRVDDKTLKGFRNKTMEMTLTRK